MIDENKSYLRKMEQSLYVTDIQPPEKRSVLHKNNAVVPDHWDTPSLEDTSSSDVRPTPVTSSWFKKIFLVALVFFLGTLGFFGYTLFTGKNSISQDNVSVHITLKPFVDGGEEIPVVVDITNKNALPLELGTLHLSYPSGDSESTPVRIPREIPIIPAGGTHRETYQLSFFGTEHSEKLLTAEFLFRVQGSNAVYNQSSRQKTVLQMVPVNLALSVPEKVVAGQELPLVFSLQRNSNSELKPLTFIASYPLGFTFTRAEPAPTFDTNVWSLADLAPGARQEIKIFGTFQGQHETAQVVKGSLGTVSPSRENILETLYTTASQTLTFQPSFITARTIVNGMSQATLPIGATQQTNVRVLWKSNASEILTHVTLVAHLEGNAYDMRRVEPGSGFFDSSKNTITWTEREIPALARVAPQDAGEIYFTIQPRIGSDTNTTKYMITTTLDVQGYNPKGTLMEVKRIAMQDLLVGTDLSIVSQTQHQTGDIINTGTIPPQVGNETTYTLHFRPTNTRNQVTDAVMTTQLPTYVVWKNSVTPTLEKNHVTYNSVTHELRWEIGNLDTGTGATPKSLSVKVGITPSYAQKGTTPPLTQDIHITGFDTFTQQQISITKQPLTTRVSEAGTNAETNGIVQVGL